jgi:hypothetical protein
MSSSPDVFSSPRTARARRTGLVAALIAAPWLLVLATGAGLLALSHGGSDSTGAEFGHVIDTSLNGASVVWYFLLFAAGSLIGTFLLGLGLWRGGGVPRWAAASVMAWSVLEVPQFLGLRDAEIVGSVLLAIGFTVAAHAVSRLPLAAAAQPQVGEDGEYPAVVPVGVDQA